MIIDSGAAAQWNFYLFAGPAVIGLFAAGFVPLSPSLAAERSARRQARIGAAALKESAVKIQHVIDGAETGSADGSSYDDIDPFTRTAYATVARGGERDVELAVAAARRAFDEGPWPRMG